MMLHLAVRRGGGGGSVLATGGVEHGQGEELRGETPGKERIGRRTGCDGVVRANDALPAREAK